MQYNGSVQIRQMDCLSDEYIQKKYFKAQYPLIRLLTFGLLQNRLQLNNDSAGRVCGSIVSAAIRVYFRVVFIGFYRRSLHFSVYADMTVVFPANRLRYPLE